MRRLIIRPGAIGDAVVSLPAVERLCAGVEAEIWCPLVNTALFEHLAPVHSMVGVGFDSLKWAPALVERLRAFDEIVSWSGAARTDLRARVCELGLPFRFLRALPPEGLGLHATDYYLQQVGGPLGAVPRLPVERRAGEFAVIHPFSGSAKKNWPLGNFRAVAARLGMAVSWCAGPEEALEDAARFETLGELMKWLGQARVYVGNDSGITHLAAACGVPVVAVFGPTEARVWAPRGRVAVMRFEDTPEAVAAAARELAD